jgi:peptidoglycan hydrolase-like protein with peptidoglycan-binding domain
VPEFRLRARRRALIAVVALATAAAVLGAATGARAATSDDPGGTSPGKAPSGSRDDGPSDNSRPADSMAPANSPAPTAGNVRGARTLRRGMHGADVRALQSALSRLGFRISPDGAFGVQTVRSVKRYERKQNLAADGMVDPDEAQQIAQDAGAGTTAGDGTPSDTSGTTSSPTGAKATLNADGTAPAGAPAQVQAIIDAGNQIADAPYRYGGGHSSFQDSGYDCSGSISYALHGAGLLRAPLDSGEFMSWGQSGPGQWVTIYANDGHAYMVVAGLRFDTSGASAGGSRWQTARHSSSGYEVRHPPGL